MEDLYAASALPDPEMRDQRVLFIVRGPPDLASLSTLAFLEPLEDVFEAERFGGMITIIYGQGQ
jgi:hypothetical protein